MYRNARSRYGHSGGGKCCCCPAPAESASIIDPGLVAAAAAAFFALYIAIIKLKARRRRSLSDHVFKMSGDIFELINSGFMEDFILQGRHNLAINI